MNSLKKGEGIPLLNFERGPGVPLLNFEGGPGVPLLNFKGVPGPTFKLWVRSWVSDPRVWRSSGPSVLLPLLQHAIYLLKEHYVFQRVHLRMVILLLFFNNYIDDPHMSLKSLLLNSRPLSLRNLEGSPIIDIQVLKRTLIISLCLEAANVAAKNLVAWLHVKAIYPWILSDPSYNLINFCSHW